MLPGLQQGPSQPHALHELREQCRTWPIAWRVDAAVRGCFAHLAWGPLREFLQQRGNDGGIVSLLGKWRQAGGLASGALPSPDTGTPQGGVLSPMVAQVCLHRVLEAWCVQDVQPRRKGRGFLTRCADDCLLGCELEADARRVMAVLPQRFARFRLPRHPAKTALRAVTRPPSREPSVGGQGSVDLLGLTHSWAKTRRGYWAIKRKTVGQRLRRCRQAIWPGGRDTRQAPWHEQSQTFCLTLRGSDQYEGLRGHGKRLAVGCEHPERAWRSWRSSRSHPGHLRWQTCVDAVHRKLPLPQPRIMHHIEERPGQQREAPSGVSPAW